MGASSFWPEDKKKRREHEGKGVGRRGCKLARKGKKKKKNESNMGARKREGGKK
jgi:hypothetical protein